MGVIYTGCMGIPKCEKCGFPLTFSTTCWVCKKEEAGTMMKKMNAKCKDLNEGGALHERKYYDLYKYGYIDLAELKRRVMRSFYRINMKTLKERKIMAWNIKKGDVFRMDEPDGSQVTFRGKHCFIAWRNAKKTTPEEGFATIDCFELSNPRTKSKE